MKKFTIVYGYYATGSVEVLANSKEEAYRQANEISIPYENLELDLDSTEIVEEKEVPELQELIKQAKIILQRPEIIENGFTLSPWPTVQSVPVWNGEEMVTKPELMENIYWDEDREEIGYETEYSTEQVLSELSDIEQFNICQTIIAQAESNGVKL